MQVCVFMGVFVLCICVHLAHLLPVCDASDRGHNPELQTTTSRRGRAKGEGGASWRQRPGEIPFKVGVMIPPCEASQHFVSALLIMSPLSAAQMGGYATSIAHSKSEQV